MGRAFLLLTLGLAFGCDERPTQKPANDSDVVVTIAMGGETFTQPIHEIRCAPEGDLTRVEAVAITTDGAEFTAAIARLNDQEILAATAFVANVTVEGEPYAVVMLVADPSVEGDASSCRLEDDEMICNDARRIPWRDTHVQTANFKFPMRCPESK